MEFALVNGERTSPIKGQRGTCPYCSGEMVAKCGRFRIWHWAHMPGASCDPWWGPESEWHRDWKGQFPADWREVIHIDEQTGEKHIADVKTPFGLVVEFQHSPIDYTEMASREAFYDDMVWIVDGDRGSLDPNYFIMGLSREPASFRPLVHLVKWWSSSRLLHKWHQATAPVYIDFGPRGLWRFLDFWPEHDAGSFSPVEQEWLIEACSIGGPLPLSEVPAEEEEEYLSEPWMVEVEPASRDDSERNWEA